VGTLISAISSSEFSWLLYWSAGVLVAWRASEKPASEKPGGRGEIPFSTGETLFSFFFLPLVSSSSSSGAVELSQNCFRDVEYLDLRMSWSQFVMRCFELSMFFFGKHI
jgi:hypothetical protein